MIQLCGRVIIQCGVRGTTVSMVTGPMVTRQICYVIMIPLCEGKPTDKRSSLTQTDRIVELARLTRDTTVPLYLKYRPV